MKKTIAQYLEKRFEEVAPMDFYKSIFPDGTLEKTSEYNTGEYCAIAIQINQETGKTRRIHITDGLPQIPKILESDDFSIIAPCSFAGRNATNKNSRFLYALQFDLDFLRLDKEGNVRGIIDLLYQTSLLEGETDYNRLPTPTYIIATSERNCHLLYLLERPIAMYENVVNQVREYRKAIIPKIWDSYITESFKHPQFETSPAHAFRMVGSWDKNKSERVRAFKTGEAVSLEYMNKYVPAESQITTQFYKSAMSLDQAKEKYPEWYQRRIVENRAPNTFKAHRGLYDWLLSRKDEIQVGHRYYFMVCLCAFAIKCEISKDELMRDLAQVRKELDKISPADNRLTVSDMVKAAQAFEDDSRFMTREATARLCGIDIQPSKRNYLKREVHLTIARATKEGKKKAGVMKPEGAPTKEKLVIDYYLEHPHDNISEIARALEVDRKTVRKWINYYQENQSKIGE